MTHSAEIDPTNFSPQADHVEPHERSVVGVVVIGRNEGERLTRCLNSVLGQLSGEFQVVYVDSGSTDGSRESAEALGTHVVSLDMSQPFTMARGRNAGFEYLCNNVPNLQYVQFIDGDCELVDGWMSTACDALDRNAKLAVVCGRRRERFPGETWYNAMADMEWNSPVGTAKYCGGDALMRAEALQALGGYRPDLICGEEPELCIRLRSQGWLIERLDAEMTLHDAAMHRFTQWWQRSIRGGWAVAEGAALHGDPPENYMLKERRSGWFWGLIIPILGLICSPLTYGFSLAVMLLLYAALFFRIFRYRRHFGDSVKRRIIYGCFCVLSKFPQMIGQAKYRWNQMQGRKATLIEYK